MTKLKNLTRKQLRTFVAILVAVCVVFPTTLIGLHVRAEQQLRATAANMVHKNNPYVETEKEVYDSYASVPGGPIDTYKIRLTTWATADSIINDKTDTILVLERSDQMGETIYEGRARTNLYTYTEFASKRITNHNDLYDQYNSYNSSGIGIINENTDNKYIVDPNTPQFYNYLCQRYTRETRYNTIYKNDAFNINFSLPYLVNIYQYSFIDSNGNVYESEPYEQKLADTAAITMIETLASPIFPQSLEDWVVDHVTDLYNSFISGDETFRDIDFQWKGNVLYPEATEASQVNARETYNDISTMYYRTGNYQDNATNATLWNEYETRGNKPFWIKDNDNNWLKVTIERTPYIVTPDNQHYYQYYIYRAFPEKADTTNPDNALYTAVYGNPEYGAEQSVFQGFRVYNSDGTIDWEHSLTHKALYSSKTTDVTKLDIEKEAVEDFLLNLHENSNKSQLTADTQRVGIVAYASRTQSFGDSKETKIIEHLTDVKNEEDVYRMIRSVYAMEANGRRRIDTGMEKAKEELNNNSSTANNVNVIAFTVGNPSSNENNNNFEMMIADNALAEKQQIADKGYKSSHFYTIGFYEGANPDELYGDSFRRLSHSAIPCNGKEEEFWGGTMLSGWTNPDMSPADAAATNRFLNYLSSNYSPVNTSQKFNTTTYYSTIEKAYYNWGNWLIGDFSSHKGDNTGIDGQKWIIPNILQYGLSTGGNGYEILHKTPDGAWNNNGYYQAATSVDEVVASFDNIADQLAMPLSTLDSGTTVRDYSTEYFNIDPTKVNAYVINEDGTKDAEATAALRYVEKTADAVSVAGFDYTQNYIASGHPGKKVVIELEEKVIDGFLGGNQVPTNESISGIYDKNDVLVENYVVPHVDIDTTTNVWVHNMAVYLTQVDDLRKLFDVVDPSPNALNSLDGLRNDFVDVKYVVSKVAENDNGDEVLEEVFSYSVDSGVIWNNDDDGEYSINGEEKIKRYFQENDDTTYAIQCIVTPIYEGDAQKSTKRKDATVYVFKPTINLVDTEKTYSQAQQGVDLHENITNKNNISWVNEDAPDGLVPTATESQPEPSISFEFFAEGANPVTDSPISNPVTPESTTNYQTVATVTGRAYPFTTDIEYYVRSSDGQPVPMSDYPDDTQNYTDIKKVYETVVDKNGNESQQEVTYTTKDENNNDVTHYVYETVVVETDRTVPARSTTEGVMYYNYGKNGTEGDLAEKTEQHTKGIFTVYVGKTFDLYIAKEFKGNYVVPEGVVFTIDDGDSTTAPLTFTIEQFERLKSGAVKLDTQLNTGVEYTISESFVDPTTLESKYNTTYEVAKYTTATIPENPDFSTINGEALEDLDNVDGEGQQVTNETFTFMVPTNADPSAVYIEVRNTDTTPDPTVTGVSEDTSFSNILLIALAAAATVSAGGYGIYRVYRPRKEEN